MKEEKSNVARDLSFLFVAALVIAGVSFFFPFDTMPTTSAVASCVDSDADGYYDEACTAADLGCEETSYVTGSSDQQSVDTDGNVLVYKDDVNGNWDIFLYNSGTTTQLSSSAGPDVNPRISSNYILWQSLNDTQWVLYRYDLTQQKTKAISSVANQLQPDISSSWAVWADNRNGDYDIYGNDFSTEKSLVTGSGNQANPRLGSEYLVYTDDSAGNLDIYLYELSAGGITQITSSSAKENAPATDGTYVVWQTDENGNVDIYGYEIATGDTFVIAAEDGDQRLPEIDDGIVTWMDNRDGDYDIYAKDLDGGTEVKLTDASGDQVVPVISSGYVFWIDDSSGSGDISGATYSSVCAALGDCDDEDISVSPGATELCDEIDNDCDLEVDEECTAEAGANATTTATTSCLQEGITYHYWIDPTSYATINSAGDGDSVYMLGYGDGTCETTSITFYVYSVTYDGTSYYTDELVDTVAGTLDNYPEENLDEGYALRTMTWPGEDTYYYFISVVGSSAEASDTLLVCEDAVSCSGTSVTVADAADYVALYTGATTEETAAEETAIVECYTDSDCDSGDVCSDGVCSGGGASEEEAGVGSGSTEKSAAETNAEKVPFFSWFNLFVTMLVLVGYYAYKSRR